MKTNEIHTPRIMKASRLALPLAALLWLPGMVISAQAGGSATEAAGKSSATVQTAAQCQMGAQCKTMMDMQRNLQAEIKNNDAQLDKLVAAMNKATGTQKIDDLAAVVTKVVSQREETQRQILAIQSRMMHQLAGGESTAVRTTMYGQGL